MYGEKHPLIQKIKPDSFIFGMTFIQLLAVLVGGKLSYELSTVVPILPVDNFLLKHIHQGIPLYIAAALIFLDDNVTGRVLLSSMVDKLSVRIRKRLFLYSREG